MYFFFIFNKFLPSIIFVEHSSITSIEFVLNSSVECRINYRYYFHFFTKFFMIVKCSIYSFYIKYFSYVLLFLFFIQCKKGERNFIPRENILLFLRRNYNASISNGNQRYHLISVYDSRYK